jgi:hypothetical protein
MPTTISVFFFKNKMQRFSFLHHISVSADAIFLFNVGIICRKGEPILLHLLCCGLFAVGDHSFTGRRLAYTATSTRE